MEKRKEYLSWDGYFMGVAALASFRSKDPNTQNGSCIVSPESMTPLVQGYNGFPRGCSDEDFPWSSPEKYDYAEHSERNAIYNAARLGIALDGSILYLYSEKGYYPCADCARAIIQAGIKEVIMAFAIDGDTEKWDWSATLKMFKSAGVNLRVLASDDVTEVRALKIIKDFDLMTKKMEVAATKLVEATQNG